jgi:Restriction alleviation protein Lar
MKELINCPFCGTEPELFCYRHNDKETAKIQCNICYFFMHYTNFANQFNFDEAKENLFSRWNKRTFPIDTYLVSIPKEILDEWNKPLED